MNSFPLYKSILIYFFLAAVAATAGCKKLIEINPPVSSVGTEQVFQSNEQANAALAGIYSEMMSNNGRMLFSNGGLTVYAGMSADELVNFAGANDAEDFQFRSNTLDITNGTPGSIIWNPAYVFIYRANAIVEGIAGSSAPQLDDSTRNVLAGEALFVRAFCYFYLTNFFGDVPLVLTTDFTKSATMARTEQDVVYDQVVKDLQEAVAKLRDDYSTGSGERVRPNKWAAAALLARAQLYRQNWEEAEAQATAVIESGGYELLTDLATVFLKNSREAIWQLKQNPIATPRNATWDGVNCLPLLRLLDYSPALQQIYLQPDFFEPLASSFIPQYYFAPQMANAFEPDDKRKEIWVDTMRTPNAAPYNGIPIYYPRKYTKRKTEANEDVNQIPQYFMVLRLAEQYLVRAEARAERNDLAGAAADINVVRRRAGLPDIPASSKEELLATIAQERKTEMFCEWGHRWLDLKRTGQASAVLGAIPAKQPFKDYQLLYPIPTSEISNNPSIRQNPEY